MCVESKREEAEAKNLQKSNNNAMKGAKQNTLGKEAKEKYLSLHFFVLRRVFNIKLRKKFEE